MLLDSLIAYSDIEAAARAMAGNYKNWRCFVWFGENTTPRSEDVMLGYLVNNYDLTAVAQANAAAVWTALAPFKGDTCEGDATVAEFGSSVWGDADMLSGLQLRVYDASGGITPAFRSLFELSRGYSTGAAISADALEQAERELLIGYVGRMLSYEMTRTPRRFRGRAFTGEFAADVVTVLREDDVSYADVDDEVIVKVARQLC